MLRAALDLGLHAELLQLGARVGRDLLDQRLPLVAACVDEVGDLAVRAGVQGLEGEVLELPLDLLHAEAVRERGVDLERLGRDAPLLRFGEDPERAHVVQAVGELDEQHADVARHRDDHLADVLGLLVLPRAEVESLELREPVDDARHLGSEALLDVVDGRRRVLDRVVQQRRLERRRVESQVGEDARHRDRMRDEVLARTPSLPLVRGLGEREGARDLARIGLGVVRADLLQHRVDRGTAGRLAAPQSGPRQPAAAARGRLFSLELFPAVHERLLPLRKCKGRTRVREAAQ